MSANEASVLQPAVRGECQRRVRFEPNTNGEVNVIIEEEEHSGDGLYEDERGFLTVPGKALLMAVRYVVAEQIGREETA